MKPCARRYKKGKTNPKIECWVIPPNADAEFVASMEMELDTYEKANDPAHPVLCMDEQPVQLTKETRGPIPATRRHANRVTNLNTHTIGAFYEAFPPSRARNLVRRIHL